MLSTRMQNVSLTDSHRIVGECEGGFKGPLKQWLFWPWKKNGAYAGERECVDHSSLLRVEEQSVLSVCSSRVRGSLALVSFSVPCRVLLCLFDCSTQQSYMCIKSSADVQWSLLVKSISNSVITEYRSLDFKHCNSFQGRKCCGVGEGR